MARRLSVILASGIILILALGLLLSACSQPAPTTQAPATPKASPAPAPTAAPTAAAPIELKFSHYNVTTHTTHVKLAVPFAQEVEKRSGGRIKVTVYPQEQLGKAKEHYDMILTGRADVAHVLPAYSPGLFPLIDIGSIPTMALPSGAVGARVMTDLVKAGYFDKEFGNVKILGSGMTSPMPIGFTKKQPKTLADFKGIKTRTAGGYNTPAYEALGMVPVQLAAGDVYDALQKGVIDAVAEPVSSWISARHIELLKFLIEDPPLVTQPSVLLMNKAAWDKLPPDLQKIVAEVGGEADVWFSAGYDELDAKAMPQILAAKATVYKLSPEEIKKMKDAVAPVNEKWVAEMEAKGLPGKKILADFYSLAEKYSKAK